MERGSALRFLQRRLSVDGLAYSEALTLAPLSPRVFPAPRLGAVGLIATWRDAGALDAFQAGHPVAASLAEGYFAGLEPIRSVGAWPQMGELPGASARHTEAPVAVLTLGRLRLHRAIGFLRASAAAEKAVLQSPALVLSTAMARPPGLVCTFSVWSDVNAMRSAVVDGGHRTATQTNTVKPFHHASAFIRYRILEQTGTWP